jgi:putative transposase
VKGTLKIKLLPSEDQAKSLLRTIKQANAACNTISEIAWDKKLYNQYKIHHETYHQTRAIYNLSAQVVALCIGKVADAYKSGRKTIRQFMPLGAITYDSRILTYWGREFLCGLWMAD